MQVWNPRDYTMISLMKQWGAVELHGRDSSALKGGCQCIEEKHLLNIETLSEEGVGFALSATEKQFYEWLADLAREIRKKIDVEDWSLSNLTACHSIKCSSKKGGKTSKNNFPINLYYDKTCTAENHVSPDKIEVCLNPVLKKHPDLHEALLTHEVDEAICNHQTGIVCHNLATRKEPAITRNIESEDDFWKVIHQREHLVKA